jgi:Kef-type K+ transport system membrane component KefB
MTNTTHSFAYVEPTIVSLQMLSSFIYLLNVARSLAHRLFYAGLIGEILVGIIYVAPLANILKTEWEQTILDFGYLGLLLLVFEGGLETRLDFLAVKSNLFLSSVIGFTGIITPIGLSILLCTFGLKFNLLESFTMGASLSATSLGTTFAILSSQGAYQLNKSRMGTILVGAALLDDISGLVIASVIDKLGHLGQQSLPWLISKPIASSIVMIVISVLVARFLLGRLWSKVNFKNDIIKRYSEHVLLFCLISTLSATVTIAAYTGASTLIGAYCCGATLRHLDDCQTKLLNDDERNNAVSFTHVFEKYIKVVKQYIFVPFFFASIGFAVPFLDLWHGQELWQGFLYALMMIFGKIITGVWIIIWTYASPRWKKPVVVNVSSTVPVCI